MRCDICGDMMRPETTIRLRRGFGRIRATRCEGAYCANCKVSVAHDPRVTTALPHPRFWTRLAPGPRNPSLIWVGST